MCAISMRKNLDPVLDASARERYFDVAVNRTGVVEPYVDRLFRAEALILCFPVWWCFGAPAILKGFMDRILIPRVSFALGSDGRMHPNLRHIRHLIAVTTYGRLRLDDRQALSSVGHRTRRAGQLRAALQPASHGST